MANNRRSTATTSTVSRVNQTAILDALKQRGPLSKQQIGSATGLSLATVNRLTAQLMESGLLTVHGQERSTGGRPAILLSYSGASRLVAVLQVGASRTVAALVDFDGMVVHHEERPIAISDERAGDRAARRLEDTLELASALLQIAHVRGQPAQALGVSVPGVVLPEGVVTWAPALDWREVPLGSLLQEQTHLPVVVENDANVLAVGELHHGAGQGLSDVVAVVLGTGIGAGIICNGQLYKGSRAAAGEIGYMLVDQASLGRVFPGFGDLESRIGGEAITRLARERKLPVGSPGPVTAAEVFAAARSGAAAPKALVNEVLDHLALAVANLCTVLDPELVVIGGGVGRSADLIIPGLRERLVGRIPHVPMMKPPTLGDRAPVVGAAELAVRLVSDFAYVQH